MTGYLTPGQVEGTIAYLAATYPGFASLVTLPEPSVEGLTVHALRVRGGAADPRRGVLLLGGVHARELVNPDLLACFAVTLCQAYAGGTGMTFGPKAYDAGTVQLLVEGLDLFIVPLVNPDGRTYVQAAPANRMWRKNRALNPGQPCRGVDLNRNYEFLFASGIGTSSSSCDDVFRGPTAFSEPETRNVRWLLDTYGHIAGLLDVHSYSEDILYPWGDDDDQTTDPSQNFQVPNPARGVPGDAAYREYISAADLAWYGQTGIRMRDAISSVRGRVYAVMQSIGLYPTTATVDDYAYSRHAVDAMRRKVLSYTIETGAKPVGNDYLGAFQPPYSEAQQIILEVSPALVEFCLATMCVAESLLDSSTALARLRKVRAALTRRSASARRLSEQLRLATPALLLALAEDPDARKQATAVLESLGRAATGGDIVLDEETVTAVSELADRLGERVPAVRRVAGELAPIMKESAGRPLSRVFARIDGLDQP